MKENDQLWREYVAARAPELRQELILRYLPLVKLVIGRMSIRLSSILDLDDILAYGTMGLIDAIDRFDPSKGVEFETYAPQRIHGNIVDALRRCSVLSRGVLSKAKQLEEAIARLQQKLGRQPTDDEIAAALGISLESLRELLPRIAVAIISLDAPLTHLDDGTVVVADILEDSHGPDPPECAVAAETRQALRAALRELPERDRQVLALHYHEELTLREISAVLGISQARVHQLQARAIARLRDAIRVALHQNVPSIETRQAVGIGAS